VSPFLFFSLAMYPSLELVILRLSLPSAGMTSVHHHSQTYISSL
jgi:hypothetical protein